MRVTHKHRMRNFIASVNEKEKRSQPYEECGPPEHPGFVNSERGHLTCRKENQCDPQHRCNQAAQACGKQCWLPISSALLLIGEGKLQQCAEHVEEWNQLQHDG